MMPRTKEELHKQFGIQFAALNDSCQAYDSGKKWEALRLATCVYNIVYDGGKIKSLLHHMGVEKTFDVIASGFKVDKNFLEGKYKATPLIELNKTDTSVEFVPIWNYYQKKGVKRPIRMLPFAEWWEKDVIYKDHGVTLTRKQLVAALRNQEGGSHYDSEARNPNYIPLKEDVFFFFRDIGVVRIGDLQFATMRQIASELNVTIIFGANNRPSDEAFKALFAVYPPDSGPGDKLPPPLDYAVGRREWGRWFAAGKKGREIAIQRSVGPDSVTCLECGWSGKMVKRHLKRAHGLSAADYLARWNLPVGHPMVAKSFSARRSELARVAALSRRTVGSISG
jgi:hypothetical protein